MAIQVKYTPRKQVIIHEMVQYDNADDFASSLTIGAPSDAIFANLQWVNGIVLVFSALLPNTEEVARDRLKGILHWDNVIFAPMPKFTPTIRSKNKILNVIDVSRNDTFRAIGKFLHDKHAVKTKSKRN